LRSKSSIASGPAFSETAAYDTTCRSSAGVLLDVAASEVAVIFRGSVCSWCKRVWCSLWYWRHWFDDLLTGLICGHIADSVLGRQVVPPFCNCHALELGSMVTMGHSVQLQHMCIILTAKYWRGLQCTLRWLYAMPSKSGLVVWLTKYPPSTKK
jgi:hypothetical protein